MVGGTEWIVSPALCKGQTGDRALAGWALLRECGRIGYSKVPVDVAACWRRKSDRGLKPGLRISVRAAQVTGLVIH